MTQKFSCGWHPTGYDEAMPDAYNQLLDATIQHLEDLKSRGVRHVAVSPETLSALARPVPGPAAPAPELRSGRREEVLTEKSEIGNRKSEMELSFLTSAATNNLPAST